MIKFLKIKNFKSIKKLELECKKINVFIGKPNTGKSNILESIGIFSFPYLQFTTKNLKELIRYENISNLFYDNEVNENIEIFTDLSNFTLKYLEGKFLGEGKGEKINFHFTSDYKEIESVGYGQISPFKFYRFKPRNRFPLNKFSFLLPPDAPNLFYILFTNKEIKKTIANILSEFELKIVLKPVEGEIEIQKQIEDVAISYPYPLLSDTLQRMIFHLVAIETNMESIIIFEEPEAHAFPYYTKYLAERITFDKTNQYFISTHNPYFLLSLIEKANKNEICIFITYIENYQTKIRKVEGEELEEIIELDANVFFNLDKFLKNNENICGMQT
jgi:AAA15 family ATPase/GTPase